jgi:hypothetical protein
LHEKALPGKGRAFYFAGRPALFWQLRRYKSRKAKQRGCQQDPAYQPGIPVILERYEEEACPEQHQEKAEKITGRHRFESNDQGPDKYQEYLGRKGNVA